MSRRYPTEPVQQLMDAGLDRTEAEAVVDDLGTPPALPTRHVATAHVHTVHPVTGLDVVFVPGETLPDWVPQPEPVDLS